MTPLHQTLVVWLTVLIVTPIMLYVCLANTPERRRRRRVERRLEAAIIETSNGLVADLEHRRAVMLRRPSARPLTEVDALILRLWLDRLPTADEPEVRK